MYVLYTQAWERWTWNDVDFININPLVAKIHQDPGWGDDAHVERTREEEEIDRGEVLEENIGLSPWNLLRGRPFHWTACFCMICMHVYIYIHIYAHILSPGRRYMYTDTMCIDMYAHRDTCMHARIQYSTLHCSTVQYNDMTCHFIALDCIALDSLDYIALRYVMLGYITLYNIIYSTYIKYVAYITYIAYILVHQMTLHALHALHALHTLNTTLHSYITYVTYIAYITYNTCNTYNTYITCITYMTYIVYITYITAYITLQCTEYTVHYRTSHWIALHYITLHCMNNYTTLQNIT